MVEAINLAEQEFFSTASVLAGGMAMRCYNSQRITIYDADFSTERADTPTQLEALLSYRSDELDIVPSSVTPGRSDGMWQSKPVAYDPRFTALQLTDDDRTFKVDMSRRGVLDDGRELALRNPYPFDVWGATAPTVFVMSLAEIAAEKTLGWCAHGLYKHYVDLAFIGVAYGDKLDGALVRTLIEAKLAPMRAQQPRHYALFNRVEDLIPVLMPPIEVSARDRGTISFFSNAWSPAMVQEFVRDRFVPLLRA